MPDGLAEAALSARIAQCRKEIEDIEAQPKVSLADRVKIARLSVHLGGLEEAQAIIKSYSEATRGRH
jgi:hypothetical protein